MSETQPNKAQKRNAAADQSAAVATTQTESAIMMVKAAFEQIASTSRDAV